MTHAVTCVRSGRTKSVKTSAKLPQDDAETIEMRFEGIRGHRYTEIFLIAPEPSGSLTGGIYNTIGLNDATDAGDSTPQPLVEGLDLAAVAKQYDVPAVFLNGPRLWCLDWLNVVVGRERDFNGLKARWVMWLDVPKTLSQNKSNAYKPMAGNRDTAFGINAGSPAFILDDPDNNSWVMKSAGLIVDPTQTYDTLRDLGTRLQLALGWTFRTVVLDADLILTPDNGKAHIVQDDLGNTYDRVGGPFSNYRP